MATTREQTEQILENYCSRLPDELNAITNLIEQALQQEVACARSLKSLRSELHRMGGSALCMGYPFLGQSMMELEEHLTGKSGLGSTQELRTYRHCANKVESIARLIAYVRPENSHMLRKPDSEVRDRKTAGQPTDLTKKRVLFADDDLAIRMLMREVLNSLGLFHYEIYPDGAELLSAARTFKPDLIITDWSMQPVDGMDILRTIRNGRAGIPDQTRVIFLTSVNASDRVQHALKQGLDYFLLKPFSAEGVARAIHRATL